MLLVGVGEGKLFGRTFQSLVYVTGCTINQTTIIQSEGVVNIFMREAIGDATPALAKPLPSQSISKYANFVSYLTLKLEDKVYLF